MGEPRTISKTIQHVRNSDGEQIDVVLCSDGKLGITCNGRLQLERERHPT